MTGDHMRLLKRISSWCRRRLAGAPANVVGPFVLPAPDDPRWVGEVSRLVFYQLDVVECRMYSRWLNGGYVAVDGVLLTDVNDNWNLWRGESRYATAVARSYKLSHPERSLLIVEEKERKVSQILAHLSRISSDVSQSSSREQGS